MRLVFVHGINHQGHSSEWVRDEWLEALAKRLSPSDMAAVRACDIVAPYYGDVLYEETQAATEAGPEPIAMSVGAAEGEEQAFLAAALNESALALGITEQQIEAEIASDEVQAMGFPHDRRLIALARALQAASPLQGKVMLRLIPQAFTYLKKPRARSRINAIVEPALSDGPCIVVGHSLGSVVTFDLLRKLGRQAPFYMTIGSPLGIKAIQIALGKPLARPTGVDYWINGLDPDDFVTLGRTLTPDTFGPGIDRNVVSVDCGDDDPHDFRMYLRDPHLAEALASAVREAK